MSRIQFDDLRSFFSRPFFSLLGRVARADCGGFHLLQGKKQGKTTCDIFWTPNSMLAKNLWIGQRVLKILLYLFRKKYIYICNVLIFKSLGIWLK